VHTIRPEGFERLKRKLSLPEKFQSAPELDAVYSSRIASGNADTLWRLPHQVASDMNILNLLGGP
jgi:hypothetical protein